MSSPLTRQFNEAAYFSKFRLMSTLTARALSPISSFRDGISVNSPRDYRKFSHYLPYLFFNSSIDGIFTSSGITEMLPHLVFLDIIIL